MTIRDMDRRTLLKPGLMSAAAAGAATSTEEKRCGL